MTKITRQGLSRFITTEAIQEDSNQKVWDAVKSAFSSRENSIGYWRYPLFLKVNKSRQEPDILLVDQEWGIIIIQICTATINDIISFENQKINFRENYQQYNNLLENSSKYLQVLHSYSQANQQLNNQVKGRNLIIFANISSQEWQGKIWPGTEEGSSFIFNNQLGEVTLRNRIEKAHFQINGNPLNDNQYQTLLSVISGAYILKNQLPEMTKDDGKTRYNILKEAEKSIYIWDVKQEWIGKSIPSGAQRIRGIAGSGKTILLTQKAVIMHLKHPDWKIAFVFFTRSLYEQIESLFKLWLNHFTNGEIKYYNSEDSNLKLLHAWGAKERDGLYQYIAQNRKLTVSDIPKDIESRDEISWEEKENLLNLVKTPNNGLAYGCGNFLSRNLEIEPIFDAIIIDEGQDLIVENDLKFIAEDGEEKQPIYELAYQALKPINTDESNQKRLIWAYDEAQTIHASGAVVPEVKELFGEKFSGMLGGVGGGIYKGDIRKAYDMERCYRTPDNILTVAYALGLGLLRPEGILKPNRLRKKDLQAIGFEVEGDFRRINDPITITRPSENSPNPIPNLWENSLIEFNTYSSREEELLALVEKIKYNLSEDKLNPSRNILVITLGYTKPPFYDGNKLETEVANFLLDYGIDIYIPSAITLNKTEPKWPDNKPDKFWCDRGITVSRIDRTKGNEADMVYLVGLDNIAKHEQDLSLRNQLFVALTRSKGWINLSGIGDYPLYDEVKNVIQQGNNFTFTLTGITPPEDANDELTEEIQL